jgi:branched-subunit amino acid aminotransferase/4-amino-4-deoxychorismate lyase
VKYIIYNGKMVRAGTAIISSENRGLRFGDGCFETMKAVNGRVVLKDMHFGRLLSSLELLGFEVAEGFGALIMEQTERLLKKNDHHKQARVRLNVFRNEGGLYDTGGNDLHYTIESREMEDTVFNEEGLVVDIYKDARKQCDHFSHLKSNNFLPYVMAARWMKAHDLDDAILLNMNDRVADSTIANVFIVKNGIIRTPVLSEGCIAGVMRKYIINSCRKEGIPVEETTVTVEDLQSASEVFLTNAIKGIRWVKEIAGNSYSCQVSGLLYNKIVKPLWMIS